MATSGRLSFATDKDTRLDVGLIKIQPGDVPSEDGFDCDTHLPAVTSDTDKPSLEVGTPERPIAAKDAILNYYADKGYLQAEVTPEVLGDSNHRLVRFDLQPGTRYRALKIELQGADRDRAREIAELLKERPLRLSAYRATPPVSEAIARYYERRGYLAAKIGAPATELD